MTVTSRLFAKALVTLAIAPLLASAAIYYVDSNQGSDDADGLTPDSAWRSLARIVSQPLAGGDYVLLRRSRIWKEPLLINSSGLPDAPITVGAYGEGARPVIDGRRQAQPVDLVSFAKVSNVVLAGIEIRNSTHYGVNVYRSSRISIRDAKISASRQFGILAWNSNGITIEGSEISDNGLDASATYDGIRLDGNSEMTGFNIRNCVIHDNVGGKGWSSSNGIFLGHTGTGIPTLHSVVISGNQVYSNGNPDQNQAGRGITGTFQGDALVTGNYVYRNASAGIYLGDYGLNLDLTFTNNIFYDNALRQLGGTTATKAIAMRNYILVDDPGITASGIEIGGAGRWQITNNAFYYQTSTTDTYRAFLRVNDATQQQNLHSDWNLFYSAGPRRWTLSDGNPVSFPVWQSDGFDAHSVNPY